MDEEDFLEHTEFQNDTYLFGRCWNRIGNYLPDNYFKVTRKKKYTNSEWTVEDEKISTLFGFG